MSGCSAEMHDELGCGACFCDRVEVGYLSGRVDAEFSRRRFLTGVAAGMTSLALQAPAFGQLPPMPSEPMRPILFTNIRVFDGVSPSLREGMRVLVDGNKIKPMEAGGGTPEGAETIDGGGRVLMPGLIDAHTHLTLSTVPLGVILTADLNYLMLHAGNAVGRFLMQGFTSARDVGGPVFGLKRAIDDGTIVGPRIWPAGAMISQCLTRKELSDISQL